MGDLNRSTALMEEAAPNAEVTTEIQLRDELLSAAVHDLRSPLGAITIFCELIASDADGFSEQQKQNLQMIKDASAKLQRIVEDASDSSAIYKGSPRLKQDAVDARALLEKCVTAVQPNANARKVTLEYKPADVTAAIRGDQDRLAHVIWRILEEAMAIGQPGDTVTVSQQVSDGRVTMEFRVLQQAPTPQATADRLKQHTSVKGRLGQRQPGESRLSIELCKRLVPLMNGQLEITANGEFSAIVIFPVENM